MKVQKLEGYKNGTIEASLQVFTFFSIVNNRIQTLISSLTIFQETGRPPVVPTLKTDPTTGCSIKAVYPRSFAEGMTVPAVMGVTAELWTHSHQARSQPAEFILDHSEPTLRDITITTRCLLEKLVDEPSNACKTLHLGSKHTWKSVDGNLVYEIVVKELQKTPEDEKAEKQSTIQFN